MCNVAITVEYTEYSKISVDIQNQIKVQRNLAALKLERKFN